MLGTMRCDACSSAQGLRIIHSAIGTSDFFGRYPGILARHQRASSTSWLGLKTFFLVFSRVFAHVFFNQLRRGNIVIEDFSLSVYYLLDCHGFSGEGRYLQKRLVSIMLLSMIVLGFSLLVLGVQLTRADALVGDLNGDGKVDVKDLAILAKAFGSSPSNPRWNSACDLNGDGIVDILDAGIILKNFGKTAS